MPVTEDINAGTLSEPSAYANFWNELGQDRRQASALAQQLRLLYQRGARLRRSLSPRRTSDDIAITPEQVEAAARNLQQQQQQPAVQVSAAPAPSALPFPQMLTQLAADEHCPYLIEQTDMVNIDSDMEQPEDPNLSRGLQFGSPGQLLNFREQQVPRNIRRRPIQITATAGSPSTAAAAAAAATGASPAATIPAVTEELPHSQRIPPVPCSFLSPGVKFTGTQRLVLPGPQWGSEDWVVRVAIQAVDWQEGNLAGTMTATNVPGAKSSVTTCWEGQIINDRQHTFYTRAWGASRETDLRHWGRLRGFAAIRAAVVKQGGRCGALASHQYIYLRLKEKFFVNAAAGCRLTIAGFYYIALCRKTGRMHGLYFDPHSSPLQELDLRVDSQQQRGMTFGAYELR